MPDVKCKNCGRTVSDEYSYCLNCGNRIVKRSKGVCVNCDAPTRPNLKFCTNCGRALSIDVSDVLNSTIKIIRKQPVILLPMFLERVLLSLIWSRFDSLRFILTRTPAPDFAQLWGLLPIVILTIVVSLIITPFVVGMYPNLVRAVALNERIDFSRAFRKSVRKVRCLTVSYVLINIIVALGTVALIVPGLFLAVWYYYTAPAIVLEDHGVFDGMDASKAFSRDKKLETFAIILIASSPSIVNNFMMLMASIFLLIALTSGVVYFALGVFLNFLSSALGIMMASYVYLAYAMPKDTGIRT